MLLTKFAKSNIINPLKYEECCSSFMLVYNDENISWSLHNTNLNQTLQGLCLNRANCRPCLLRCASVIAHHHTPILVLKSAIFSTPKSGKIIHNKIQNSHLQHTWIPWEVIFVAQQAYLQEKPWADNAFS